MTRVTTDRQRTLRALLGGPPGRAHLMGVCGVGVAGVARLLASRGWQVSGCDASPDAAMAKWLEEHGIAVIHGHEAGHAGDGRAEGRRNGILIHTAAVPEDHPEIVAAGEAGSFVCRRGEALAALVALSRGVAVCGAHGKTTTACFAARLLQDLGASPSWCIGGRTSALDGVAGVGGSNVLVVEADESDGTLALYHPAVTVLNNIDLDHLEHFAGEEALVDCYRQAVRQTRDGLAYGADDARATAAAAGWRGPAIGFGLSAGAALRATNLALAAGSAAFDVAFRGTRVGRVELPVTGEHNVRNALGGLAAAILLGHAPQAALEKLAAAADRLPGRRFDLAADAGGVRVVSDYAHHPAEVAALAAMARLQGAARVVAVFQPHRYTRTKTLGEAFPAAFDGVDEVILAPVYAASEAPLEGGGICDLYAHFRRLRPERRVRLARSVREAWEGVRRELRAGDLLLAVGAGDVVRLAGWAAEALAAGAIGEGTPVSGKPGAPRIAEALAELRRFAGLTVDARRDLSHLTTYGVGGCADLLVEAATPAALAGLLAWGARRGVPVHALGAGANTWASDLGVAGAVVRLRGEAFRGFGREGTRADVGCGWSGPALLDRLEAEGLAGLEFLDGVPGQVGGWLAMNAGAHGAAIGECVERITCLNADGAGSIVPADAAGFEYRRCAALENRVAWQVSLRLAADAPEAIHRRRLAFRGRRAALAGLRTAGSAFRNPPGGVAGRLLDAAGAKAWRVGGAAVAAAHANVAVAGDGATASDILALLGAMRARVRARDGVTLAPEVRLLGPGGGEGLPE
jgi:UDP-N-acetylmuramate--L-alanine ligase/UDP-N-acetylenolpyruvoylglucosamine reductase